MLCPLLALDSHIISGIAPICFLLAFPRTAQLVLLTRVEFLAADIARADNAVFAFRRAVVLRLAFRPERFPAVLADVYLSSGYQSLYDFIAPIVAVAEFHLLALANYRHTISSLASCRTA